MEEVARFLDVFQAIAYCDKRPDENLITCNEWGYFVVYNAGGE